MNSPPAPIAINPNAPARPPPPQKKHLKFKMAAINGKKRYISTISRKNTGGTVNIL